MSLTLSDIHTIRNSLSQNTLRRCGVAYSLAVTYMPGLCDIAEETLAKRALENIQGKVRYSLGKSSTNILIKGSDGFQETFKKDELDKCIRLLDRLNS